MAFLRIAILLLLLASATCFGLYAWTGQARHRQRGLLILKWTVAAALGFFAVLIADRLAG